MHVEVGVSVTGDETQPLPTGTDLTGVHEVDLERAACRT